MLTFEELVASAVKGRFAGIDRIYKPKHVLQLRGSFEVRYTIAEIGAVRLWNLLQTEPFVAALGAISGNQAMQMVRAGLKAIYLSGWQVAADNNTAGMMYPDQSLYPQTPARNYADASTARFARRPNRICGRWRPTALASARSSRTPRPDLADLSTCLKS